MGKLPILQSLDTSILPLFFEETPLLLLFKYPSYEKKYSNDDDDDDPLF